MEWFLPRGSGYEKASLLRYIVVYIAFEGRSLSGCESALVNRNASRFSSVAALPSQNEPKLSDQRTTETDVIGLPVCDDLLDKFQ